MAPKRKFKEYNDDAENPSNQNEGHQPVQDDQGQNTGHGSEQPQPSEFNPWAFVVNSGEDAPHESHAAQAEAQPAADVPPVSVTGVNVVNITAGLGTLVPNQPLQSTAPATDAPATETGESTGEPKPKKRKRAAARRPRNAPEPDYSAIVREKNRNSKRTPKACDRCSQRKMKCDQEPGCCKNCAAKGLICQVTDKNTNETYERGIVARLMRDNKELEGQVAALNNEIHRLQEYIRAYAQQPNGPAYGHGPMYNQGYVYGPGPMYAGEGNYDHRETYAPEHTHDRRPMSPLRAPPMYPIDPALETPGTIRHTGASYTYGESPGSVPAYSNTPARSEYPPEPIPTAIQPPTSNRGPYRTPIHLPHLNYPGRIGPPVPAPPPFQPQDWQPSLPEASQPNAIFNPDRIGSMDPSPFVQPRPPSQPQPRAMNRPATIPEEDEEEYPKR